MTHDPVNPVERRIAAETLAIDALTARMTELFESRGIESIVLKGPAVVNWLYGDGPVRAYGDSDLLVAPENWQRAHDIMKELGFVDALGPLAHPRMESITSHAWVRGQENVDLHCTMWGIGAEPAKVWELLSARTVPMNVGGREVHVLAPGPRALHLGLHAAQHGDEPGKANDDISLAIAQLPFETWVEAAELAAELDATPAFAAGLLANPDGRDLAERLGVSDARSVDTLLRGADVPLAQGFNELAATPGIRAKLGLMVDELFPTAEFMRWWSPLAGRGRLGLVLTYVWRPIWLALRAGPGFIAWRRARREGSGA